MFTTTQILDSHAYICICISAKTRFLRDITTKEYVLRDKSTGVDLLRTTDFGCASSCFLGISVAETSHLIKY